MMMTVMLEGGGIGNMLVLPLLLLVMYFFFFRPQIKRQKEEKKFRLEISKGMRIVTNSGIHGKILDLKDDYIVIESENSRLKIDKSAISKELSAQYLKTEKSDKTPVVEKK